jgi:nucleotide-binding universal stress UspA family protein
MYRVLVAVDSNEERAEAVARAVADLPGDPDTIEVVLLNVFEEFAGTDEGRRITSDDLYDAEEFPESVDAAHAIFADGGHDPVRRRDHGEPAKRITAVAADVDADLIALSGRKRSPTGKALFGSVTQSVLLSADRPVLVAMG